VLTGRVLHQDAGASPRNSVCGTPRPASKSPVNNIRPKRRTPPRLAHDRRRGVFQCDRREGIFRFAIVFVDETGRREAAQAPRGHGMDGANVKYLDGGKELVVTPRFSPPPSKSPTCRSATAIQGNPAHPTPDNVSPWAISRHDFRAAVLARRSQIALSLSDGASTNLYSMTCARAPRLASPKVRRSTLAT